MKCVDYIRLVIRPNRPGKAGLPSLLLVVLLKANYVASTVISHERGGGFEHTNLDCSLKLVCRMVGLSFLAGGIWLKTPVLYRITNPFVGIICCRNGKRVAILVIGIS